MPWQVKKMVNAFWERLWQLKEDLEDGVEQSLEAVGLIEERVCHSHDTEKQRGAGTSVDMWRIGQRAGFRNPCLERVSGRVLRFF